MWFAWREIRKNWCQQERGCINDYTNKIKMGIQDL